MHALQPNAIAGDPAQHELMHPVPPLPRPHPEQPAEVLARHRVTQHGDPNGPVLLLAHGFGSGQSAWNRLLSHLLDHRVTTFDHLGSGSTDVADFDHNRHASLTGYAEDVLAICAALDLHQITYVGHSVSSMIGALAAAAEPHRFASLVLIAPSPRYIDDPADGYVGGFSHEDITELFASLDSNYYAWSAAMAPLMMGNHDTPELGAELTESFLGTHPDTASTFARAIFLSDTRAVLARIEMPTLVLRCRHDALAPEGVGQAVAEALPAGDLVHLRATGHCPHVSAPAETAAAIIWHLASISSPSAQVRTERESVPAAEVPAPRSEQI